MVKNEEPVLICDKTEIPVEFIEMKSAVDHVINNHDSLLQSHVQDEWPVNSRAVNN